MIKVYCGELEEDRATEDCHPVTYVTRAYETTKNYTGEELIIVTNSLDFIGALYYFSKKRKIKDIEFYLNRMPVHKNIEKIYADFNRSIDMLNHLLPKCKG